MKNEINNTKNVKTYLLFGRSNVEAYENEKFEDININDVHKFEFKSFDEQLVFAKSMVLHTNSNSFTFIFEKDYKIINNI